MPNSVLAVAFLAVIVIPALAQTPQFTISTFAGNGVSGFSGDGGPAISAMLNSPVGVVPDSLGNLYIVDTINNRIRKVAPGGTITTFAGTGVAGFGGDGGPAITADRVDIADGVIIIESLKKRRKGIYRAVPVPPSFLDTLEAVHGLKNLKRAPDSGRNVHLWPWSRPTGWRYVCAVMEAAGIAGLQATPKGLRHAFGIKAVVSNVPLNMAQKWLGHADLATTAIYADAIGPEEKQLAERMWD